MDFWYMCVCMCVNSDEFYMGYICMLCVWWDTFSWITVCTTIESILMRFAHVVDMNICFGFSRYLDYKHSELRNKNLCEYEKKIISVKIHMAKQLYILDSTK